VVGHITPEAYDGGTIALVKDDDRIVIDVATNTINLAIAESEIAQRKSEWKQPALKAQKGILYKYAKHVTTAAEGCVTDGN
jgi:dihydroxy-acid dehydratase